MGWKEVRSLADQVKVATEDFEACIKRTHERYAKRVGVITKNMLLVPKLIAAGISEGDIQYLTEWTTLDSLCIDLGRKSEYKPGEFVARMRMLRELLGQMRLSNKDSYGLKGAEVRLMLTPTLHDDITVQYIDVLAPTAKCQVREVTRTITERQIVCEK